MNGPAEAAAAPWHPQRGFETASYERMYRLGGPGHAVQLWVNLPSSLKLTAPWYQAITRDDLLQLTNDDGGALLRLIAGTIADYQGPGVTHTPITYVHATIAPGAQLSVPLDVLLLGGLPIREPIAHYGPFVMNSRDEITQAITDYRAGRTGIIPADQTAPRRCS